MPRNDYKNRNYFRRVLAACSSKILFIFSAWAYPATMFALAFVRYRIAWLKALIIAMFIVVSAPLVESRCGTGTNCSEPNG